jgi:osmotically-inducible protein OsmY
MAGVAPKASGRLAYPYGRVSRDEELLAAVLNALHHNSGAPHDRLRVEVRNGRVALSGVAPQDYMRGLAERAVASVPGVVEIANEITLER